MRVSFANGKISFQHTEGRPQPGNYGSLSALRFSTSRGVVKYLTQIYGNTHYSGA